MVRPRIMEIFYCVQLDEDEASIHIHIYIGTHMYVLATLILILNKFVNLF